MNESDASDVRDERSGCRPRKPATLATQMRLIRVSGRGREQREPRVRSPRREGAEALEPEDPLQRLGAVPESISATPEQLALTEPDRFRELGNAKRAAFLARDLHDRLNDTIGKIPDARRDRSFQYGRCGAR